MLDLAALLFASLAVALWMNWPAGARSESAEASIPQAPRPISIYSGQCSGLADVVWPLNALTSPDGTAAGVEDADRTEYSFTANVPLTIDSLLTGQYAINVLKSEDDPTTSIACGNVGGVPDSLGTLVLGLRVQGDWNVTGIAVLSPSPSDPTRTLISVFITGSDLGTWVGKVPPQETVVAPEPQPGAETPVVEDPTAIIVPTKDDDPGIDPTEVEIEPTEDDVEPTEVDGEPTEVDDDEEDDKDDEDRKDDGDDDSSSDDDDESDHESDESWSGRLAENAPRGTEIAFGQPSMRAPTG